MSDLESIIKMANDAKAEGRREGMREAWEKMRFGCGSYEGGFHIERKETTHICRELGGAGDCRYDTCPLLGADDE